MLFYSSKVARVPFFLSIALLMLFPSTSGLSFGTSESIVVPKSEVPIELDGRWTTKTEWLDASEIKLMDKGSTAYFRAKHDGAFLYVLIDFVSDHGIDKGGDLGMICLDTRADSTKNADEDDYCFYRITRSSKFLDGVMQGNGIEWIVVQESRVHDPYDLQKEFEGKLGFSHSNDPYDNINSHVHYELRIPMAIYGLTDTMRLYVYVNDAYSDTFLEWPADAGGKEYRIKVIDVLPSFNEWADLQLEPDEDMVSKPAVQLVEEEEEEEDMKKEVKAEVRVQAKQIKDLIIVRLRNMQDSQADIHGFKILLPDSLLKAFKGPREWSKERIIDNEAIFSALNEPIHAGDKEYFLLKVDDVKPLLQWAIYGSDKSVIAEGSVTPFLR